MQAREEAYGVYRHGKSGTSPVFQFLVFLIYTTSRGSEGKKKKKEGKKEKKENELKTGSLTNGRRNHQVSATDKRDKYNGLS